jgi:hypothetical protein
MSEKKTDPKVKSSPKYNKINIKISNHSQRQSIISKDNLRNGFFRKAIPIMPTPLAIFCMVLNIILPGIGKKFILFGLQTIILILCVVLKEH